MQCCIVCQNASAKVLRQGEREREREDDESSCLLLLLLLLLLLFDLICLPFVSFAK